MPGPAVSDFQVTGPGSLVDGNALPANPAVHQSLSASATPSSTTVTVDDEVTNFDSIQSGPFDVVYYASTTSLPSSPLYEFDRRHVSSLGPQFKSPATHTFALEDIPFDAISGGRTYIGVGIDSGTAPTADDIFWQRVDIPTDFGVPDLIGLDFDLDPFASSYAWGQSIAASFSVKNIGTGYAQGPFQAGVYLSQDAIFDATDYLFGIATFDGLQGGSTAGNAVQLALPAVPPQGFADGPMYIGLLVDRRNDVANELSETNNQGRGNGIDYRAVNVVADLPSNGDPVIGLLAINGATNLTILRGENVNVVADNVVDDGVVNEILFRLDSNDNGVWDDSDLYVGYGSKSGVTFSARVATNTWPLGTHLLFAQAKDNYDNRSRVAQAAAAKRR